MNRTEFYDCARALFGVEPEYPWPDEPGYGMLHSRPGFFLAYHMNKEHWISAALDGSVDAEELRALLAESFARTAPKKRAPRTKGAAPAKPGGGAG